MPGFEIQHVTHPKLNPRDSSVNTGIIHEVVNVTRCVLRTVEEDMSTEREEFVRLGERGP